MPSDTTRTAPQQRVVIFDHADAYDDSLGPHERIAACFRLAKQRGWNVEELCGAGAGGLEAELDRALAICEHIGARLLAYAACWSGMAGLVRDRLERVGFATVREPAALT